MIPSLTTEQMKRVDALMIQHYGITLLQMMENAGRNLAELALRLTGPGASIVVLAGSGNNGGGGMAAARHLHNRGLEVQVIRVQQRPLKDAPMHQWRTLEQMGLRRAQTADLSRADLLIDAMIGYGLRGSPDASVADWIRRANAAGKPILALDTPSGLDASNGQPAEPCIRARATLTLALPKHGLLVAAARPFVGDLYLADIGVPPELYRHLGLRVPHLFASDSILPLFTEKSAP